MKNHHIFLLRTLAVLVAVLVFTPTVALCYDVYGGGYDSYTGSYGSNWDYDNSAYDNSYQYNTGDSSNSSGGSSGSSGSTGSSGSATVSVNATTKVDLRDTNGSGYGAVFYNSSGALEIRALADWTKRLIYVKSGTKPDYTKVVGEVKAINWITDGYAGSWGYIDVNALENYLKPATPPASTPAVTTPAPATNSASIYATSAPAGARLVTIDSNAYVHDTKTGTIIDYAMPELFTGKIYNKNTSSRIGLMLSATTGYLDEYVTYSTSVVNSDDTTAKPAITVSTKSSGTISKPATAPVVTPAPTVVVPEVASLNKSIPAGAKLVFVENIDGVYTVFDKETGAVVPLAFYDFNTKSIYYGNSDELYGKMLTDSMGYVEPGKFAESVANNDKSATTNTIEAEVKTTNQANQKVQAVGVGMAVSNLIKSVANVFAGLFKSFFGIFNK
ncbi:MAG: hypothetical protein A3J93_02820 [Candidatus Magasanikbacteria bacterium RIFOXYC2_FULL_42_28]|uniref:Uncharacterized protein n=1 Tax=Candidatus Magasanikbacteria bacterium RIFOXYC2_FULL_42_28 TaxID=1798704 RepID=A0A1F6NU82_9BACT|nr:MAG: hypothetical protein A3J93_02820 [Candidatus Magasanikbacteria bacterium RIFOXYC2_FULL_42_28]